MNSSKLHSSFKYWKESEALRLLRIKEVPKGLPPFSDSYQAWYSEAKVLIKQLLPDRLDDFVRHYEKPKSRKEVTYESYRIEDCLQGLILTRGYQKEKVVGPDAALPHLQQQSAIVKSVKARFESSLFDIRQLVQADLFDSELSTGDELVKKGFTRAAGAVAGVVLEKHLSQVCENHGVKVAKKNATISDFNDALKAAEGLKHPCGVSYNILGTYVTNVITAKRRSQRKMKPTI